MIELTQDDVTKLERALQSRIPEHANGLLAAPVEVVAARMLPAVLEALSEAGIAELSA